MVDEGEKVGNLDFPPARRTVSLPDRVTAHDPDRQVGSDYLPCRLRIHELALEPCHLRRSEDRGRGTILAQRGAVRAHVQQENVEKRAV